MDSDHKHKVCTAEDEKVWWDDEFFGGEAERYQLLEEQEERLFERCSFHVEACLVSLAAESFLRQSRSRGKLSLSREAVIVLLDRIGTPSPSIKLLTSHGFETGPSTDGISYFHATNNNSFHTSYTLKHIEPHFRSGVTFPYSLRQCSILQTFSPQTRFSGAILIQTPSLVQNRIFSLAKNGAITKLPEHWTYLHETFLGRITYNWKKYIKLVDEKMGEIDKEVIFSKLGGKEGANVTFEDLQILRQYSEILIRIVKALDLNREILEMLGEETDLRRTIENGDKAGKDVETAIEKRYEIFTKSLKTCIREHIMLQHQACLARECADGLAVQLRDTIALQDSNVMLTLAQKTISETLTMKTITFIALIYLPASFTSTNSGKTFMSMNLVHVESLRGVMKLNVSQDMWFYLAITLPLMSTTLVMWWVWNWRTRRAARAKIIRENQKRLKDV
ncbi:hypothetical protein BJ875DRAFT_546881 [Amylocarpus encephaloides]|uniref:Uncharacterized protein n=1 Tax=Amylocarpus encephaloides TaxID=45428 RepID=A0A9P7YAN9_9HELO|nr:hypothetical protein BJ875DRAFT_546881 [Amylocarpus encephaloides]